VALALVSSLVGPAAPAQALEYVTIFGQVKNTNGDAIGHAAVKFHAIMATTWVTTYTDEWGYYEIELPVDTFGYHPLHRKNYLWLSGYDASWAEYGVPSGDATDAMVRDVDGPSTPPMPPAFQMFAFYNTPLDDEEVNLTIPSFHKATIHVRDYETKEPVVGVPVFSATNGTLCTTTLIPGQNPLNEGNCGYFAAGMGRQFYSPWGQPSSIVTDANGDAEVLVVDKEDWRERDFDMLNSGVDAYSFSASYVEADGTTFSKPAKYVQMTGEPNEIVFIDLPAVPSPPPVTGGSENSISWSVPADTGNSFGGVTAYEVVATPDEQVLTSSVQTASIRPNGRKKADNSFTVQVSASGAVTAEVSRLSRSFAFSGLDPNTDYTITVRAKNVVGVGPGSYLGAPTYSVTYHDSAATGTVPVDGNSYLAGDRVKMATGSSLTNAGMKLVGWLTDQSDPTSLVPVGGFVTMANEPVNLYAVWAPIRSIQYSSNEVITGSLPVDSRTYVNGDRVKLPTNLGFARTGYTFAGWLTDADDPNTLRLPGTFIGIGTTDLNLYTAWTKSYTLTYSANSGSGSAPVDTRHYLAGEKAKLPSGSGLSNPNFVFAGWLSDPNDMTTLKKAGTLLDISTSDVTLYAAWANPLRVTYFANGGSGVVPTDTKLYAVGDTVTLARGTTLYRSGYTFLGWLTKPRDPRLTTLVVSETTIGDGDLSLYAAWRKIQRPAPR
jgi:uncharacterized repeat protein (TIGR02543 family)